MQKIWQKGKKVKMNKLVEEFLSADDIVLDQKMIAYDIYGSLGHLKGLVNAGILDKQESKKMIQGLKTILKKAQNGRVKIKISDEDVHTVIEKLLFKEIGPLAGKLHSLRSRNDQVLVDIRLYSKEHLLNISGLLLDLIKFFIAFAEKYKDIPMPGYTHMQKAMVSSVTLWTNSFTESLFDDFKILQAAYDINDRSPLGSAAGYGTPIPIDRKLIAQSLGFSTVQENYLYCQNSRGKTELNIVHSLLQTLQTLNKFASDLLLFTMDEFGYFVLPDSFLTGSSIMPQKKNYDVLEIIRAQFAAVSGKYQHIVSLISNLLSGYNRDFQEIKNPLFSSFTITEKSLSITSEVIKKLTPNEKKLNQSITSDLLATTAVYKLVQQKVPFRKAYQKVGKQYFEGKLSTVKSSLVLPKSKSNQYKKTLLEYKKNITSKKEKFTKSLKKL